MVAEIEVWLVFFMPLASFAAIVLVVRPFFNRYAEIAGYLTVFSIALAAGLSIHVLQSVADTREVNVYSPPQSWLQVGELDVSVGVILDPLTAIMLLVVTSVSLVIQVYSIGYMRGDPGYARYFAYMSLFTASMIGLVIASNIVQLYVFWELVGLCSYLLIGFWYQRPAAAAAAKKAFIVTRFGDFGFLLAILYLVFNGSSIAGTGPDSNPLDIATITGAAKGGLISASVATWLALGIFAGAVGKSGQFPLHTWLPDAMEGPTPVSALIHAATMVAAGVFLVARFFPLFEASEIAMNTVALVGGFTALFAATMALAANDIKRVLAYSTVSQLGYMMLALGVGAYGAAIFHLVTHAFFKSLLFLGSGSVNHATGTFDMRYMGGLRKYMPSTYYTFLIGSLSLAAIFPVAGFWSKDEILTAAFGGKGGIAQLAFAMAAVTVVITALYVTRVLVLTFWDEFRGGADADPEAQAHGGGVHLGEPPAVMVVPLVVLAIPALLAGFFLNPPVDLGVIPKHWLTHDFLRGESLELNGVLFAASALVTPAVLALGFWLYRSWWPSSDRAREAVSPATELLTRKYYMDDLYEGVVTVRLLYGWIARSLDWFDQAVVDGLVRLVDRFGRNVGRGIALAQTGQLQGYGVAISVGLLAIFAFYLVWR